MKKKLYLHVGYTKTGSTSLQVFCRSNQDILYSNGICYPELTQPSINHHDIMIDGLALKKVIHELKESTADIGLISAETMYQINKPQVATVVRKLMEEFEVILLIYLRNPIDWVQSIYAQEVAQWEHRFIGSISEFINYKRIDLNFLGLINEWEKVLGSNMIVKSYDYIKEESDLFSDLLNTLDVKNTEDFIYPEKNHNPSLSHTATHLLQKINIMGLIQNKEFYQKLSNYLKEKSYHEDYFYFISQEDYQLIKVNFYKKYLRLSKKHFNEEETKYFLSIDEKSLGNNEIDFNEVSVLLADIWRLNQSRN